jgi:hypothetical protein
VRFKPRHWMEMISVTILLLYPHQELLGTEDASLLGCSVVSAGKLDCLAMKMEALYSFETSVTVFQSTRLEHRCESLISKSMYLLNGKQSGSQKWFGRLGEEYTSLPLPEIEPRLLGRPVRSQALCSFRLLCKNKFRVRGTRAVFGR